MATRLSLGAIIVVAIAAVLQTTLAQTTHVVGDSLGWLVPPGGPIAYSTWAALQTFTAGDILVFDFTTGQEDKLAISVTAGSGPTASPAPPPPPPSSPVPAPPRAPVTYVVGDGLGWLVPPGGAIAYATWAFRKTFMVGDTLVFNFVNGTQDVAVVTKSAYETCDTNITITVLTTSPAKITLTTTGEHYFTSTYPGHCTFGQQLAINVTASSGPTASPAPPPPPHSSPVPAPPRAPVTYVVGDGLGWLVPPGGPIAYSTWAFKKTFMVGDTLVFDFVNGTQDVAVVTKSAYETCDTNATITVLTTSPVKITLTTAGEHYFTCTYPRHCALGQKLAINVTAATPPTSYTSSPAFAPTAGGPAPLPFSSALYRSVVTFHVTFFSIVIAFFFS
ncbi:hypothetical protein F0562_030120 [Nyssa sinensis]|uniref:Phytocyanin domain-containing protein n=1 Tax=Nyssa sinensis TaxID=561372 RepID=A0A5J5B033_9ASTE|nr:hypothetical protein F0562_030120 [Nyssa sinensis]